MRAGQLVHRLASPEQAKLLRLTITNYRKLKKLLRLWEAETERWIDAQQQQKARFSIGHQDN
jgi:hypothetical protein